MLRISIERKTGVLMLGALAVALGGFALSEQLTLTTSYPVPSGIYNQLITTGNSGTVPADTTFNRNAGNTILVPQSNVGGKVGIGTNSPSNTLSVAGSADFTGTLQLANLPSDPAGRDGAVYYNTTSRQYRAYKNGAWGPLGGAVSVDTSACTWRPSGTTSPTVSGSLLFTANNVWYPATCAPDEVVWGMAVHEAPAAWEHLEFYCCRLQ